jgi:hypothetical protein
MTQQQPIHVVVEKKGGCLSGCGTAFAILLLIALAVKYWYVVVGILVLVAAVGVVQHSQRQQQARKAQEQARRKPGPRDPWLNEVAVALAEFGFTEHARNTGQQVGGAPLEGDIGLQADRFFVYVNLFAGAELARQAEVGLRANPDVRRAIADGKTALRAVDRVLYVANGRGGVVDEPRLDDVVHLVHAISPPPPLRVRSTNAAPAPAVTRGAISYELGPSPGALEQLRQLGELRVAGVLTDAEFEAKKAELLRRI